MNKEKSAALSELHLGMTFGFYARNGYHRTPQARAEVDRMAAANVRWVVLIVTVMHDTWASPRQYRDFINTPDDAELRGIIDYIHSKGMKVKLRPMLEGHDGTHRWEVSFPPDGEAVPGKFSNLWSIFFQGMTARSVHYARIAQQTGCEMYGLDSELDNTVWQQDHWRKVIHAVREVYDGPVTTCQTDVIDYLKELQRPDHWWRELDMLTTSFYRPSADKPRATVEERVRFLQPQVEHFRKVAELYGKPFLFGECGCISQNNAGMRPHDWMSTDGRYDPVEQADHFEAVLQAFWNEPLWHGMYVWKWDEQNIRPHFVDDPAGDKGFTIAGKPAEEVIRRWYGREDIAR